MGATVTTGKSVSAFLDTNGKPYYLLWEQTYEKNCYPHTPRWSCNMMGYLETVVRKIFLSGSACEGGMLQGSNGRGIAPESYIASWLKELANPVEFPDQSVTLKVGDLLMSAIQTDTFDQAKGIMATTGHEALAVALEGGEQVTLSMHTDIELLNALYLAGVLRPWRIVSNNDLRLNGLRNPELGYAPKKVKAASVSPPRFLRISAQCEDVLIQNGDGSWRNAGWGYNCVSEFIIGLWESEMREPGNYRAQLKEFREALKAAPALDRATAKVCTDTTVDLRRYERGNVEQAQKELPCEISNGVIQWSLPESPEQLYLLTRLPTESTKWVLTESPRTAPTAPMEQLSLLAA
ncbi:hypothetical protein ACI77O_12260 [Pseudomonas tritici]|uniref:hypothetical protein n=1 Tax=Pseudomonas tritici TaxID=2745518 RepID=UPI00387B586A